MLVPQREFARPGGRSQPGAGKPARQLFQIPVLSFAATHPIISIVFNKSKGGDPMSSDFVFQNVASADCTFGKQSSR